MSEEGLFSRLDLLFKSPPFQEKDMSSSPKFTAPLLDRSVIAGYTVAISCAVRGNPKVLNCLLF